MLHLATSASGDKPTVVLVHGAFAESSSFIEQAAAETAAATAGVV